MKIFSSKNYLLKISVETTSFSKTIFLIKLPSYRYSVKKYSQLRLVIFWEVCSISLTIIIRSIMFVIVIFVTQFLVKKTRQIRANISSFFSPIKQHNQYIYFLLTNKEKKISMMRAKRSKKKRIKNANITQIT